MITKMFIEEELEGASLLDEGRLTIGNLWSPSELYAVEYYDKSQGRCRCKATKKTKEQDIKLKTQDFKTPDKEKR